jgi:hypothetical protein
MPTNKPSPRTSTKCPPIERAQPATQPFAKRFGTIRQLVAQHDLERGQAGCARHGMSPESRHVAQRRIHGERPQDSRAGHERSERHASAESLGQDENVRHDLEALKREQRPGPAEAGDDLVEDQERADPFGAIAQRL